jgi:hypothetical protein
MDAVMPFTIGCRTRMGVVRGQYLSVTSRLRRRPSEFPTKLTPHPAERYTPSSKTFHFQTRSVTRQALAGALQRTAGARSAGDFLLFHGEHLQFSLRVYVSGQWHGGLRRRRCHTGVRNLVPIDP